MNCFRFALVTVCYLTIAPFSMAQVCSGGRIINRSELSDVVDQEKVDLYLNEVVKEIEKLIEDYPQLSSWKVKKEGKTWFEPGKERTSNRLTYAHGLKESKSSNYLDWYGTEGFHLDLRILSQRDFSMLSGSSVDTVVFGLSVAEGRMVASMMSANPKVPELEKKITEIIKRGLSLKPCF